MLSGEANPGRRGRRASALAAALLCFAFGLGTAAASSLVSNLNAGAAQTVVVYGTSLTAGGPWIGQMQTWLTATYPGSLTVVNSGMGGRASNTGLANLSAYVLAYNPDTVFIEFAMNDAYIGYGPTDPDYGITLARSASNLNAMIDQILAARPNIEIILQTMNTVWDAPNGYQSATLRPQLSAYYQGYRDVAQQRGLLLIDHHPNWLSLQSTNQALFEAYVPDGVHPSAAGCEAIVLPTLKAVLPQGIGDPIPPPARPSRFIIQPIQVAASSFYPSRAPENAINGSGLSLALPTGAAIPSTYPTHDTSHLTTWLSDAGGSGSSWIHVDLGETNLVTGFHQWNYNEDYPGYDTAGRGTATATVLVSADDSSYTDLGSFTFAKAGSITPQTNYVGETYSFAQPLRARHVVFTNATNFGVDSYVGISEIRFLGSTPPRTRGICIFLW